MFIEVSNDPACNAVWNKVWNIFILRCCTTDNDYLETLILFRRLISCRWFVLILLLLTLINSAFLISLLTIKVFASFTAFCKPSFPGDISEMYYTWQLYFSQLLAPGVSLYFLAQYWQSHLGWYVAKFYLVWFKNFLCWCYITAMYDYYFIFFEISTKQLIQIYKLSVRVHYDHSVFLIFKELFDAFLMLSDACVALSFPTGSKVWFLLLGFDCYFSDSGVFSTICSCFNNIELLHSINSNLQLTQFLSSLTLSGFWFIISSNCEFNFSILLFSALILVWVVHFLQSVVLWNF